VSQIARLRRSGDGWILPQADSRSDRISVVDKYEKKHSDEIIRALTACKGRVGGADGAPA
jgi:hypothetical protein